MAGATKRTSVMLVVLALLFIITIIILCLVPDDGQPRYTQIQNPKNSLWQMNVLNDTTPLTTTTTTTSSVPSTTTQPSSPTTSPTTQPPPLPTTSSTTTIITDAKATTTTSPLPPTPMETSTVPTTPTTNTTELKTTTQSPQPQPAKPTTTPEISTTTLPPSPQQSPPPTTTISTSAPPPPPSPTTTPASESSLATTATTPAPPLPTTATIASPPPTKPLTTTTTTTNEPPHSHLTTTNTPDATHPHTDPSSSASLGNVTSESSITSESSSPLPHPMSTQEPTGTTSEAPKSTIKHLEEALTTRSSTSEAFANSSDSTISPTATTSSSSSSTPSMLTPCPVPAVPESEDVCMTPACKTLAARMLDLMSHSSMGPCEDFYQYACGGVTDDLFLDPENQQKVTNRLILDNLKDLSPNDTHLGPVKVFYDSCTAAKVQSSNKTMWLSHVKAVFNTVGSVFGAGNMGGNSVPIDDFSVNLTQILVAMMKIHVAPFFDLLLDIAEDGTDRFVLMLTPPMLTSPFSKNVAWGMCYGEHLSRTNEALHSPSPSYDINEDYALYSECIGKSHGLGARLYQIQKAVEVLDLMHHFNYTDHAQGVHGLFRDNIIDTEYLLMGLHEIFPRKPDLRERHLNKNFKTITLSYLEKKFDFSKFQVEWQTMVEELLGHPVDPDNVTIHIYFEDSLYAAFETINFLEPSQLQRILLLLFAERLYTDLVEPAEHGLGEPEYCLRVTTQLFGDFVSSLYLDSLPRLQERQQKMEEMIRTNKKAAEVELMRQPNLKPDAVEMWLNKLRSMSGQVADPEPSQYLLQEMNETTLSDNFVDNCLILLTRYRSLMYQQYQGSPSSPKVLWSHFLRPFSSNGVSLYPSNIFLIPYAAMEAPFFFWDVPDYINYAGIGQMIAHELMHGFDGTGILYNGTQRQTLENLSHFVNVSECLSYQYRAPQTQTAASGLKANFNLGRLPLNEILADSGAVRLAWEAYELSFPHQQGKGAPAAHSFPGRRLPWLDLNPLQLYFLRIAQTHCTATSDIHMLPLMENEHLPSTLRVNLMLRNEPLFTEAFSCSAAPNQCPYVLG